MKANLAIDVKCILGEGPVWHHGLQELFWVDIENRRIYRHHPDSDKTTYHSFDKMPGALVPIDKHEFLIAFEDGIALYDWTSLKLEYKNRLWSENPMIRANDGKCDPNGRFWIGTMHLDEIAMQGDLFRLDFNFSLKKMIPDRTISNGLAWTKDQKTMYYIDSPEYNVKAYDFNPKSGDIRRERVVIDISEEMGAPDGMALDANDKLWIAHWGGSCVRQWDPESGEVLNTIEVPAPHVTSCTFGGQDLDILYITTARSALSQGQLEEYPLSGAVFKITPGIAGKAVEFFKHYERSI